MWGRLRPSFPAGAKTVTVKVARFTGTRWVSYRTYQAVNASSDSGTRYSVKVRIPRRGRFRFKATSSATSLYAEASTSYSRAVLIK